MKIAVATGCDTQRDITNDDHWQDLAIKFRVRPGTIYLNHGSFGLAPDAVRFARRDWLQRLEEQPMDFFVRQVETELLAAKRKLAEFVGTETQNLVFVENATTGLNVVASSLSFSPGDKILVTDHSYGAVNRTWLRAVKAREATVQCASLPWKFESEDQIVDCLLAEADERTRLLSISHVTSCTGLVLPIKKIVDAFHRRGILVCVDGPHAPAQVDLDLDELGCDFYVASCHKWMSAPFGTGFLYVSPDHQHLIQPLVKSWGRLLPEIPETWSEEFTWTGARDPSAYLAVPAAIEFLEMVGVDAFQARTRWLASHAEHHLRELFQTVPIASREDGWYASMAHVPLPSGDWSNLQRRLWEEASIEVPVIHFAGRWFIRVSCHLYNTTAHVDLLVSTLKRWVA